MSRRLATQSMLFSTGEGAFNTGSAVFLTQVVGMSAAKVGLALTIINVAEFLFAYPAGRIVDRLGPKRVWAVTTWARAGCFVALPFVGSFEQYLVVGLFFAVFGSAGGSAYQAYVLDVLPAKERVETQAYMYSALNVGFTLGALIGGVALAFDSLTVVQWTPLFAGALMAINAWWIGRLPQANHDLRVASGEVRVRPDGPGPIRNVGWILTTFCLGVLWTNQVLLNIVIPLWLVLATDAPQVLLAWLFGTNTVLCIFLPAYTSQGVKDLKDGMRYVYISSAFFVASCVITAFTHSTVGLVTVLLVWLGHVTVTGAELYISGASWSFQAELMDPKRRGEYQGVQEVSSALGSMWAPALFTFLAMEWGAEGWMVIAAIIVGATVAIRPSLGLAERFARQHFPQGEEEPSSDAAAEEADEAEAAMVAVAATTEGGPLPTPVPEPVMTSRDDDADPETEPAPVA